ncbi:MAG: hypothetical protein HBSIN02_01540 [Bacteroidia bacterium]|nr:MAG: hypothetical protein HBSIN02_01540 [Bacteroidia bacterium]
MKHRVLLGGVAALLAMLAFTGFASHAGEEQGEKEKARAGWLGVSIRDVTKDVRAERKLPSDDGAYVVDVVDESPADSAGLKKGDVIVEFGGRKIYDADDLSKSVKRTEPGTRVPIVVLRNGEKKTLLIVVGKYPRPRVARFFAGPGNVLRRFQSTGMLGMTVMTLNEQLARYFGAPNDEGVLVESVEKGSAAEKAGIAAGDVILRVGSRSVDEIEDLWRGLDKYEEGDTVEIEVLRKGSKKTLKLVLDEEIGGYWGHFSIPPMKITPDLDFDFEYEVTPHLREIERKMEKIGPRIEREIREKVKNVTRSVTI